MKLVLLAFVTLVSTVVFAAKSTYQIDSQIFVDGRLISSPRIIAEAGGSAEITQENEKPKDKLSFKVIAEDFSNEKIQNGILMNMNIEYTVGSHIVKVAPQILSKSGSEATMAMNGVKDGEVVLIKVTATRK